jgi:hypothetical protein
MATLLQAIKSMAGMVFPAMESRQADFFFMPGKSNSPGIQRFFQKLFLRRYPNYSGCA